MARVIDRVDGHAETWGSLVRLQERGRLPHAMVFIGPAGIGKRQVAWALAQNLVCTGAPKPCGVCPPCIRVDKQQSESVLLVEPNGTQIKIESATRVLDFLSLGRLTNARIIIVDEAEKLNPQTANALLKVVEEPPPATYFVFICPEISQLLPTLRSRAQVLRFKPLSAEILSRAGNVEPWMTHSARGSFEKLAAFQVEGEGDLRERAFEFLGASTRGERAGLERFMFATKDREDALQAVRFLQQGLRDWSVLGLAPLIHDDQRARLEALPNRPVDQRVALWRSSLAMEGDLLGHIDRGLVLENFFYRSANGVD